MAETERDRVGQGRAQMWIALANIRDACGPGSEFRREAESAIGTSADPDDGTPEQIAMDHRRALARQRDQARVERDTERARADKAIELLRAICDEKQHHWCTKGQWVDTPTPRHLPCSCGKDERDDAIRAFLADKGVLA